MEREGRLNPPEDQVGDAHGSHHGHDKSVLALDPWHTDRRPPLTEGQTTPRLLRLLHNQTGGIPPAIFLLRK